MGNGFFTLGNTLASAPATITALNEAIVQANSYIDADEFKRICREDGYAEGLSKGQELGRMEKAVEAAVNFLKEGDSPEKIARCTGLPLEKVRELAESITVKA